MSPQSPSIAKEILDRNIAALNNRDMEAYLANQHPDIEFVVPGGATLHGREQVRESTQAFWTAFPDGRLAFGEQVLGEDSAATEVVFTGTHTGPMSTPGGDVPPTSRVVQMTSVSMLRFKDGMVAYERVFMDQLQMLTQLGLAPVPAGA
jgi:predicted ester cyclase